MTTANVDSMEVHHNTWTSQIKDVNKYQIPNRQAISTLHVKSMSIDVYIGHERKRWRH